MGAIKFVINVLFKTLSWIIFALLIVIFLFEQKILLAFETNELIVICTMVLIGILNKDTDL